MFDPHKLYENIIVFYRCLECDMCAIPYIGGVNVVINIPTLVILKLQRENKVWCIDVKLKIVIIKCPVCLLV